MPQNPNPNQDRQRSQTTNNPDSWAGPKGTADGGFVRLDNDDLHPQRVERIGQYLSDTSKGELSNLDVTDARESHYPVSPPGETTRPQFQDQLDAALGDATAYFNELKRGHSFEAGIAEESDGTYGSGHELLSNDDRARNVVLSHIRERSGQSTSRWHGIGKQRFDPSASGIPRYQVQRSGESLDANLNPMNTEPHNTKGSFHKSYRHKTGQNASEAMNNDGFWNEYFARLGLVGAKITLGAQGYDLPPSGLQKFGAGGGVSGAASATGSPSLDDLKGNYAQVSLENIEPENVFYGDGAEPNRFDELNEEFKMKELASYTDMSYGQMHSWSDPFESTGFPLVENRGLRVAGQLLEIWAMSVLKTLVTTALLQIASYLVSAIMQNLNLDGDGLEDYFGINWNANYYPESPLLQPGSAFFKGYSGFNHPATNLGQRMASGINRATASVEGDFAAFAVNLLTQQTNPIISDTFRLLDTEILNFTVNILRELNIYIPRHMLSQMAQDVGYNSDPSAIKEVLKQIIKLVDIGTAYTRAMTVGMTTMAVHLIGADAGKSLGFYRTLFREVVRSKAVYNSRRASDTSSWEGMLAYFGKDDKIMRFVNYLAMIGDISIGAGDAGNIAFPENKVPLDMVGNHPSLRTIGGRRRGQDTQSRLSLTDTPSLFLLPRTAHLTRENLVKYGLEDALYASEYASLEGENKMYVGADEDWEGIKSKFQRKAGNRFEPDQVRRIEDQLEAEHMPFYIQDLRTNEIISFHAFLTSISDSYSAEWSGQKGFGRMEAAQIYGGGSRSIAVNFLIVPMNKEDFDEMYYKINKLTTLVYPQWSRGTMMENQNSVFVQPFSQVPTASPLCRIRVGDLFTSNYSDVAMARMMGIDDVRFKYTEPAADPDDTPPPDTPPEATVDERLAQDRRPTMDLIKRVCRRNGFNATDTKAIKLDFNSRPDEYRAFRDNGNTGRVDVVFPPDVPIIPGATKTIGKQTVGYYLDNTVEIQEPPPAISIPNPFGGGGEEPAPGLASIFDRQKNPIMKSFNSTMGRGIAVAITSIGLDWKLNSAPWNMEPGNKAPRMCEVSLSLVPIHDITPGLDSQGINRAPIYKVGKSSKSLTGDVWHDKQNYQLIIDDIEDQRDAFLRAEETPKTPSSE